MNCAVELVNNTIVLNRNTSTLSTAKGGGLYCYGTGSFNGLNNIIWENISTTYLDYFGIVDFTYTDCSQGVTGNGCFNEDPMFVNMGADDFNLEFGSPCINAGDPNSPLDPDGTRADIGALPYFFSGTAVLVPNHPTDFVINHNNELLIATLSWTNPAVNIVMDPLTELSGVRIYRDDVLITEYTNVTIGQPSEYNDDSVPVEGLYDYVIVPFNQYGDGMNAEASCWIGLDIPGTANNVIATPNPNYTLDCTIEWDDPTEGQHGAYFPPGSYTGQRLYRDGIQIANLTGTNNSYLDISVSNPGFYTYSVSYYNEIGEGNQVPAVPNPVFVGMPEYEVIDYVWDDISATGTNTGLVQVDQVAGPFDIGFDFPFYGYDYVSQFWISTKGWISFIPQTSPNWTNTALPNGTQPNNAIYGYWDDIGPYSGAAYYLYDETNSRFIIQYTNFETYGGGGNLTFQMILHENGDIDLVYNTIIAMGPNSATVGIENEAATDAIQVTFNGSGPINPSNEMTVRIYSVSSGMADVSILMIPAVTPIQIPAGGGSFDFSVTIENNSTQAVTLDAWIDVLLPLGGIFEVMVRPNLTIAAGGSLFRAMTQNVPATAPEGQYTYNGHLGAHPNVSFAVDGFIFEKLSTGDGINPDNTWNVYGWDGDGDLAQLPTEFDLEPAFPNPFNPQTTLRYDLPSNANASLIIYDIQGRVANQLVNGWHQAGSYEITFDAARLASGVYFVRYQAGTYTETQKLLLVK